MAGPIQRCRAQSIGFLAKLVCLWFRIVFHITRPVRNGVAECVGQSFAERVRNGVAECVGQSFAKSVRNGVAQCVCQPRCLAQPRRHGVAQPIASRDSR